MEIATIGLFLLGGGAYLRWKPTRAQAWNYIAAWAAENRDAAITREARKREYLAAEVIAAAERALVRLEDLAYDWVDAAESATHPLSGPIEFRIEREAEAEFEATRKAAIAAIAKWREAHNA